MQQYQPSYCHFRLQGPDHDAAVNTAGADLADTIGRARVLTNCADGVLVDRLELRVVPDLASKIHLSEHVER